MNKQIDKFVQRKISRGFDKSILIAQARNELFKIRKEQIVTKVPTCIYDVYDMLNESFEGALTKPVWLQPYIDVVEDSIVNDNINRIAFSAPPRHSKSFSALVSLVFAVTIKKGKAHAYITYNQTRADEVKKEFIGLLEALGITYRTNDRLVYVTSLHGGRVSTVRFTSIEGKITGTNLDGILFIDDCIGSMEEALSPNRQKLIKDFYDTQVLTRGIYFSVIVMNTRWTTKDLIQLLIDRDYEYIRIPAICDDKNDIVKRNIGDALWSNKYPIDSLLKIKEEIGEYTFSAMYQGEPIVVGATPVKQISKYLEGFQAQDSVIYSYGIDLAYSGAKHKSDYCAVVCLETNRNTGITHVTRCMRRQCLYRDFIIDVKNFTQSQPGNIYFCAGGYEEETSGEDFRKVFGGRMVITQANKNKYTRFSASGAVTAFQEAHLLLPVIQNEHMSVFENQLLTFSGADLGPGTDDFVDALSAAYNSVKHIRGAIHRPMPNKSNRQIEMERQQRRKVHSPMGGRRNTSL